MVFCNFSSFLHHFVLVKLTTSCTRVKAYICYSHIDLESSIFILAGNHGFFDAFQLSTSWEMIIGEYACLPAAVEVSIYIASSWKQRGIQDKIFPAL